MEIKSMDIITEKGHYETVKEYTKEQPVYNDKGDIIGKEAVVTGRELNWVLDDTEQLNKIEIAKLKQKLADTDYQAIKYAEGELSEYEYAPIKAQRAEWRRQINELEKKI